ncbi:MAG: HNH endonuclease [Myxococcales bacterium]|nr:HNH endonuclease [Myxococcales bacterium]
MAVPNGESIHRLVVEVYREAGFRCGNPACGQWIALDHNNVVYVVDDGGDVPENLLPLCPSCYSASIAGRIPARAIQAWKSVLLAQNSPFDLNSLTFLVFLEKLGEPLDVDSRELIEIHRLVASGAVSATKLDTGAYRLELAVPGHLLLEAWRQGQAVG